MSDDLDQLKGKGEELKGKAKQAWGDMTDDTQTEAEGKGEEIKGKARQKMGEARDRLSDLGDDEEKRQ